MLQLTNKAIAAVLDACAGERLALRILVGFGCKGLSYSLGLESEPAPDDQVVELDGLTVYVDPASAPLLAGTTMDYVDGGEGGGFVFDNPNAPPPAGESCSCSSQSCR